MTLNPQDRRSWQGLLDAFQPPSGYRLAAAFGTTFGLSMDALLAALISMCDADGEALSANPVAATIAATRLSSRVRVLVHPATIVSESANPGTTRIFTLLEPCIIQVRPPQGLFHPKVWVLRFTRVGPERTGLPADIGRVLVGSRNLTRSTSFELGVSLEGLAAEASSSAFGKDVSRAMRAWMAAGTGEIAEPVRELPRFVESLRFEPIAEAQSGLRLRWQGLGGQPLIGQLPSHIERAVIVSPFIQPPFVEEVLRRSERLEVVSIAETLDRLPDETLVALEARAKDQGSPVLYEVAHHEIPDDACIEGVHAKLCLLAGADGNLLTLLGSANATGPGWGHHAPANTEAMVEMRPGMDMNDFVSSFIRETRRKPTHPWIAEYVRGDVPPPDEAREAERHLLAALREVANLPVLLRYEADRSRLIVSVGAEGATAPWVHARGAVYELVPLALAEREGAWRTLSDLRASECVYDSVTLAEVGAFVLLRGRLISPQVERTRLLLARLDVQRSLLDQRDASIRADIMATADPAQVLTALIRGIGHLGTSTGAETGHGRGRWTSLAGLLSEITLERLLQAVALEPSLVVEMRLLLGPRLGGGFLAFCDNLDAALREVALESHP